jgi:cation:H+ antiporter
LLQLLFPIFILIGSLLLLAVSSGIAIKAVEKIIEFTGLSEVSAGFIILAVLTSVPEMLVALFAGLQGVSGISIGNILGSNIFNIGGVLGVLGVFGTLKLCCTNLFLDLSDILFITSAIPLILVIFGILSPIIGGLLFVSFFGTNIYLSRKRTPVVKTSPPTTPVLPMIDGEACVLETKDQETNKINLRLSQ